MTVSYGKDLEVAMGNTLKVSQTQELPEFHVTFNAESGFEATMFTVGTETSSSSDNKPSQRTVQGASDAFELGTYTLAITDPDAPSYTDKEYSEYLHYLVTGLKPKTPSQDDPSSYFAARLNVEDGNTLVPYMGPAPPPKTGKHRYVCVVLRETKGTPTKFEGDRPRWGHDKPTKGLDQFAKKHGLVPVAVNFFYAQNEEQ